MPDMSLIRWRVYARGLPPRMRGLSLMGRVVRKRSWRRPSERSLPWSRIRFLNRITAIWKKLKRKNQSRPLQNLRTRRQKRNSQTSSITVTSKHLTKKNCWCQILHRNLQSNSHKNLKLSSLRHHNKSKNKGQLK